jgi:hypothetical protein
MSGSLTRLDFHKAMDDTWRTPESFMNVAGTSTANEFAIEKVPARRHRQSLKTGYSMRESVNLITCNHLFFSERNSDIVLPSEQITYVHYFSNQQRRLQHLLEESAKIKKSELEAFVFEGERICYVNSLWKSLLSSKSSTARQRQTTTLFSSATSKQ